MIQGPREREGQGAAYVPMTILGMVGGAGAGEVGAIFFDPRHNYLLDGVIGGFAGSTLMILATAALIYRANTRSTRMPRNWPTPPRG